MSTIHAYIHFPENIDDEITSIEKGREIIKDFQMTIDLADCEKDSKLYYSKTNKENFFDNIEAHEELNNFKIGGYEFKEIIEILFNENDVKPVDESKIEGYEVKSFQTNGGYLVDNLPSVFYDIVRKDINSDETNKQIILNLFNAFFSQNPILLLKSNLDAVETIQVDYVINFTGLDSWLQTNRQQRKFNNTDARHIENNPSYIPGKSPLVGGISARNNASQLLINALGDKRRTNNVNDLVNFDDILNEYLWYEYEGDNPNNQFHAYHLVKPITHERDNQAVNRIPDRIINLINYRKR